MYPGSLYLSPPEGVWLLLPTPQGAFTWVPRRTVLNRLGGVGCHLCRQVASPIGYREVAVLQTWTVKQGSLSIIEYASWKGSLSGRECGCSYDMERLIPPPTRQTALITCSDGHHFRSWLF
jgi:hypothetical protein